MVFPPLHPESPGYRRYDKGVSVTWDLRPESILPAGFISKAGHSEGTELCQASWLPPAFPLNCKADDRRRNRTPQGIMAAGFNAESYEAGKNDPKLPAEKRVMFPRPCSSPQQMTVKERNSARHPGCRVQIRSIDSPEERFGTPGRNRGHLTTVRRDIIQGHRTCRNRFQDTLWAVGVSPWCCRVL